MEQAALKQCVCLFAALSVNGIVAVCEPVKKLTRPVIRIMLGKKNYPITIQYIGNTLFAIRGLEFEPASGTHELNTFLLQLTFKPTPIVTGLCIIRLIIDSTHHIRSREPPAVVLVIPDCPHLAVIEKPYRPLAHYSQFNNSIDLAFTIPIYFVGCVRQLLMALVLGYQWMSYNYFGQLHPIQFHKPG